MSCRVDVKGLVRCIDCIHSESINRRYASDPVVITCSVFSRRLVGASLRKCGGYQKKCSTR